ncbi:MAG: hypothetical protein PHI06_10870 [Desulfobulbaceae bacterium]|nr:hypothetical protein [Desulfobulbaceae bacterium]
MLCPKCGFISFDHFSACVKCQNDLSQIGLDLQGTATDAVCQHFLGLAHREDSTLQSDYSDDAMAATTIDAPLDHTEVDRADDLGEEASLAFPEDESQGLEFDLEEIPQLDLSGFEPVAEDEGPETPVPANTTAENEEPPPQPSAAQVSPPDDTPGISDKALEIDTLNLSMDSEQSQLEGLEDSEETPELDLQPSSNESTEELTLDLDEIDLSDLVHQENKPTNADADEESGEGLAFEDTMDLSLFSGDENDTPKSHDFSLSDTGIEPIDLTLMDEALVELSVDPSRKETSFQKEAPSEDFALSMEDPSN